MPIYGLYTAQLRAQDKNGILISSLVDFEYLPSLPIMMAPVSCAGGFLAVFEDYFYFF